GQFGPEIIHLFLRIAIDLERDGLVEFENRAPVESSEGVSIELELHDHHRPCRLAVDLLPGIWITGDLADLRILEDGGVELGSLFGLGVEPQARGNLLNEWHISGLLLKLLGSRVFAHP